MDYIAFIHKEKTSDYGVSFPDIPGCVTAGETLEKARLMAQEALKGHLFLLREEGERIPLATALDQLIDHEDYKDAAAVIVVSVPIEDPVKRINITVPQSILKEIDAAAEFSHMKRSAFLTEAGYQKAQEILNE
jgi:predicted RNase H-like HicB family nuclease